MSSLIPGFTAGGSDGDYTTTPSDSDMEVQVTTAPGDPAPTIGYDNGGTEFSTTQNPDGSYTTTVFIPSTITGGTVTVSGGGTYTIGYNSQYVETFETVYEPTPPPPPIQSNDYQIWLDTYFPDAPTPATIICRNRETNALVGTTQSSATTGAYVVPCYTVDEHYLICIYDDTYVLVEDKVTTILSWDFSSAWVGGLSDALIPLPTGTGVYTDIGTWTFNADGSKLYGLTEAAKYVVEYTLLSAYELEGATQTATLSLGITDTYGGTGWVGGIHWRANGLELYIASPAAADVFKYTLTVAWDLSTATYSGNRTTGEANINLRDEIAFLHIDPTGTFMTIADTDTGDCWQYKMSTPWDLTTIASNGYADDLIAPSAFAWNDDATEFYSFGYSSNHRITKYSGLVGDYDLLPNITSGRQYLYLPPFSRARSMNITPDGSKIYCWDDGAYDDNHGSYQRYMRGTMATAFDLVNIVWDAKNLMLSDPTDLSPDQFNHIFFKGDGTIMMAHSGATLYKFLLSTPWEINTAVEDDSGSSSSVSRVYTRPDGAMSYWVGSSHILYSLAYDTPYGVATTGQTPIDMDTTSTTSYGFNHLAFGDDGNKVFFLDTDNDAFVQIDLLTPYTVPENALNTLSVTSWVEGNGYLDDAHWMFFNSTGTRIFVIYQYNYVLYYLRYYDLSTAWEVSSASFNKQHTINDFTGYGDTNFAVPKPDGTKLYTSNGPLLLQHEI